MTVHTMIERRDQTTAGFSRWLYGWKQLADDGWAVEVLLSADESHVVALACSEAVVERQSQNVQLELLEAS